MTEMQSRFDEEDMAVPGLARPAEIALRNIERAANQIILTVIVTAAMIFAYLYWKHNGPEAARPVPIPRAAHAR